MCRISKDDTKGAKSVSYFERRQTGTSAYKNLLRVMGVPKSHDLLFFRSWLSEPVEGGRVFEEMSGSEPTRKPPSKER